MKIKVKEIKREVKHAHKSREHPTLLLLGPPGIGKSINTREAAKQLAEEKGKEFAEFSHAKAPKILDNPDEYFVFLDLRLTEVEPTDLIGMPKRRDGVVVFLPLQWAQVFSKTEGILFLDELTNVQRPDVLGASFKLIRDERAGFVKFHPKASVVCAGNTPEHSSVANMIPVPLANGLGIEKVNVPSFRSWAEWMDIHYGDQDKRINDAEGWDHRTFAFMKKMSSEHTNIILDMPNKIETLSEFASPRTWTWTAIHPEDDPRKFLGDAMGTKYKQFIKVDVPSFKSLVNNPGQFKNLELDAKYISATMIGAKLDKDNIEEIKNIMEVMAEERQEYPVITLLSAGKNRYRLLKRMAKISPMVRDLMTKVGEWKHEAKNKE